MSVPPFKKVAARTEISSRPYHSTFTSYARPQESLVSEPPFQYNSDPPTGPCTTYHAPEGGSGYEQQQQYNEQLQLQQQQHLQQQQFVVNNGYSASVSTGQQPQVIFNSLPEQFVDIDFADLHRFALDSIRTPTAQLFHQEVSDCLGDFNEEAFYTDTTAMSTTPKRDMPAPRKQIRQMDGPDPVEAQLAAVMDSEERNDPDADVIKAASTATPSATDVRYIPTPKNRSGKPTSYTAIGNGRGGGGSECGKSEGGAGRSKAPTATNTNKKDTTSAAGPGATSTKKGGGGSSSSKRGRSPSAHSTSSAQPVAKKNKSSSSSSREDKSKKEVAKRREDKHHRDHKQRKEDKKSHRRRRSPSKSPVPSVRSRTSSPARSFALSHASDEDDVEDVEEEENDDGVGEEEEDVEEVEDRARYPSPMPPPPTPAPSLQDFNRAILDLKADEYETPAAEDDALTHVTHNSRRSTKNSRSRPRTQPHKQQQQEESGDGRRTNKEVEEVTERVIKDWVAPSKESAREKKNTVLGEMSKIRTVPVEEPGSNPSSDETERPILIDASGYLLTGVESRFGYDLATIRRNKHIKDFAKGSLAHALSFLPVDEELPDDALDLVFRRALQKVVREVRSVDPAGRMSMNNPVLISGQYLELRLIQEIRTSYLEGTSGIDIVEYFNSSFQAPSCRLYDLVKDSRCEQYLRKLLNLYHLVPSTLDDIMKNEKMCLPEMMRVWTTPAHQMKTNTTMYNAVKLAYEDAASNKDETFRGSSKHLHHFITLYSKRMQQFYTTYDHLLSEILKASELMSWVCFGVVSNDLCSSVNMAVYYAMLADVEDFDGTTKRLCWNYPLASKYNVSVDAGEKDNLLMSLIMPNLMENLGRFIDIRKNPAEVDADQRQGAPSPAPGAVAR